ncbi:hypothetical protein [Cellulomonas sp. ICMP 17802]|uniref:hypothetical protein n=1 Tax=Cellulomonas sp. ICMP 17802 TaxID=3239199 RepID=UPI00351B87F7
MTEHDNHHEDAPMISDTALGDPALRDLFAELSALADRPTPPIGEELAALLAGATPLTVAPGRRNRAAKSAVIGLVTAGILAGGVTAAAAANELPAPAQRVVSRVITTLTPLEIPNPDEQGPVEHQTDSNLENGDDPGQGDQPGRSDPVQNGPAGGADSGSQDQEGGQTDPSDDPAGGARTVQQGTSSDGTSEQRTRGSSGESGSGDPTGDDSPDSGTGGGKQGGDDSGQ